MQLFHVPCGFKLDDKHWCHSCKVVAKHSTPHETLANSMRRIWLAMAERAKKARQLSQKQSWGVRVNRKQGILQLH